MRIQPNFTAKGALRPWESAAEGVARVSEAEVRPESRRAPTVFELAALADCAAPASADSPGAVFLTLVADCALGLSADSDTDLSEAVVELADSCVVELADSCVPLYTHERWQVFCDLGAYEESLSDVGTPTDLTEAAGLALYQIAYRLAHAILEG